MRTAKLSWKMRPRSAVVGWPAAAASVAAARYNSWRIRETVTTTGLSPTTLAPDSFRNQPEKNPGRASQVADLPRITKRICGDLLVRDLDRLCGVLQTHDKALIHIVE